MLGVGVCSATPSSPQQLPFVFVSLRPSYCHLLPSLFNTPPWTDIVWSLSLVVIKRKHPRVLKCTYRPSSLFLNLIVPFAVLPISFHRKFHNRHNCGINPTSIHYVFLVLKFVNLGQSTVKFKKRIRQNEIVFGNDIIDNRIRI